MKDSVKIRSPGSDRGPILICIENTRDRVSVRFDGAPLDLCHGPAIEGVVSKLGTASVSAGFDSRCQLLNCLDYGPTQPVFLSAVQSPVKGPTDVGTIQP